MDTVKEAAASLLTKGDITQDEFNIIKQAGLFGITKESAVASPGKFKKVFTSLIDKSGEKFISATSSVGNKLRRLWPLAGLAAIGVGVKETMVDPFVEKARIKKSFETMSSKVPQLAEKSQEELKDYFNVIKTFSPKAASNPLVAGALVNKMMEFGGVDHKLVQDIAAIESGLARPSIVQSATESAASAISAVPKFVAGMP